MLTPRARVGLIPTWGWILALVVAFQVAIAAIVPLLPEEAYHWNFARHLDWGYFDHPPMVAWAIALGRLVLGDTPLGVRLIPLLLGLGTILLLVRMAQRFFGKAAAQCVVLLYAVQPAMFFVAGWGFPDAPLLFFWTLTLTWVWQALETRNPTWWLAAGAALGGGMLSKYTAAFLVPSVLLYLLCSGRDRRWLATPWPYLAGVCSLVVFTPVLYWNWTHQWASFRFQGTARFQAVDGISLAAGLQSTAELWLFILPLTLPLAVSAIRRGAGAARPAEQFLFWSFAPMAGFFFLLGWTPSFHLLWPLPAYLSLTVAMAGAMAKLPDGVARFYRARWPWLAGIGASGMVLAGLHAVCVLPGLPPLRETYGWDMVAQRSRALWETLPEGSFYLAAGGRSYPPPSQLAFHLDAPSQVHGQNLIGLEALQYRYWGDPQQLAGKDAVVVVVGGDLSGFVQKMLRPFFQAVEPAEEVLVPVGRIAPWPTRSLRFTLYRAHGYRPPPGLLAGH
jgi:dolichol-phosphate mannosyltransferase